MGNTPTKLPPPDPSQSFFSMYFKSMDKIRIILADQETIEIIRAACRSVWPKLEKDYRNEDGSYHIRVPGAPFSKGVSFESSLNGKLVALHILCRLYAAGWDFALASDLTRRKDYTSWFFRKVTNTARPVPPLICLSLSSSDAFHLISHDPSMNSVLKSAVEKSYSLGIQKDRVCGGSCYELTLIGFPWEVGTKSSTTEVRKMLLEIIQEFNLRGYQFYATVNLKGTSDSLFFIQTTPIDTIPNKFAMISLNDQDRLRLIDLPADAIDATRQTVVNYWKAGLQKEKSLGCMGGGGEGLSVWEFQLNGYPWWAIGSDAVYTRSFLTNLFTILLQRGWCVVAALDISRKDTDKSIFLLRACQPTQLPHFCISLNETDKLRLIGAGADVVTAVRVALSSSWPGGIQREQDYYGSHEFKMAGEPWSPYSANYSCLTRAMMCRVLATVSGMGWRVISSADVSAKYHKSEDDDDYPSDVHSWFVVYTGLAQPHPTITIG